MKLFRRKSRWDRIIDVVTSAAAGGAVRKAGKSTVDAVASAAARGGVRVRKAGKVSAGVVGGAVAATVASAAVSAVRDRDGQA
jgi:hypothetical protein